MAIYVGNYEWKFEIVPILWERKLTKHSHTDTNNVNCFLSFSNFDTVNDKRTITHLGFF